MVRMAEEPYHPVGPLVHYCVYPIAVVAVMFSMLAPCLAQCWSAITYRIATMHFHGPQLPQLNPIQTAGGLLFLNEEYEPPLQTLRVRTSLWDTVSFFHLSVHLYELFSIIS